MENTSTATREHDADERSGTHAGVRLAFAALLVGAAGVVLALCLMQP